MEIITVIAICLFVVFILVVYPIWLNFDSKKNLKPTPLPMPPKKYDRPLPYTARPLTKPASRPKVRAISTPTVNRVNSPVRVETKAPEKSTDTSSNSGDSGFMEGAILGALLVNALEKRPEPTVCSREDSIFEDIPRFESGGGGDGAGGGASSSWDDSSSSSSSSDSSSRDD